MDVLAPTRILSQILIPPNGQNDQNVADTAIHLLSLLGKISSSDTLASQVAKSSDWAAQDSQAQKAFSSLFEKFLGLEKSTRNEERCKFLEPCLGLREVY